MTKYSKKLKNKIKKQYNVDIDDDTILIFGIQYSRGDTDSLNIKTNSDKKIVLLIDWDCGYKPTLDQSEIIELKELEENIIDYIDSGV